VDDELPLSKQMKIVHRNVNQEITWATQEFKRYYDSKRRKAPEIKEGTHVYLKRRTTGQKHFNIKTPKKSAKLDNLQLGPFRVERKLENDNYRLRLPSSMRIHPVFHISLLMPTGNEETTDEPIAMDESYEVEKILGKRVRKGKTEYLIKWAGYDDQDNTWEPTEHLNCPERVQEFTKRESDSLRTKN